MQQKPMEEQEVRSILDMEHIVCDRLSFIRDGFLGDGSDEVKFKTASKVEQDGEGRYRVILNVTARREGEYEASVQITGYCRIDEACEIKDELLEKNAVAILFPFARAQLTLLTAQPETEPIVLPAFNINALLEKNRRRDAEAEKE